MSKWSATGIARSALAWLAVVLVGSGFVPAVAEDTKAPVAVTGILEVLVEDDFATGRSRYIHRLREAGTGKVYRLDSAGAFPSRLLSGSIVTVRGIAEENVIVLAKGDGADAFEVIEAAVPASGVRRAVILLIDFQNGINACSEDEITETMFTGEQSVDGLYQETSFGTISFPADTDLDGEPDVFRISVDISIAEECDLYAWTDVFDAQAQVAGIDLEQYQHKVYILPNETTCGWIGLGMIGCGDSCEVWLTTCQYQDAFAHEVGHNLGMLHAAIDLDNDDVDDCSYCDRSDIMGFSNVGWRQVNGPHKELLGWLPAEQIVEISPGDAQIHAVSPLEIHPDFALYPQLLKVFRPDSGDYYYFSYRQRTGYDANLSLEYTDQTTIHHYAGYWENTYFIDALEDGQSFVDESIGLTVTQLSHDPLSATVQLTLGSAASCSGTSGDPDPTCNDGVFCNGAEICMAGSCQSGTPVDCDDGFACTADSCNEATDSCSHTPNDGACSDGQFCNGPETCSAVNGCQPAVSAPCDGQMCDELSDQCAGCLSNADCDDGIFCNGQESCSGSQQCQTGTPPDCTSQQCSEAMDQCVDCLGDVHCGAGETCHVATGECILLQPPDPLPILTGDEWRYFKGAQEPPSAWNSTGFDDFSWLRGPGGFGYGTDCASVHGTVLEDMQNSYVSLYMRRAFVVDDPSAVDSLTLTVDYDDSFVAYLNGVEVARNNVTGNPPAHNQPAGFNHECSGAPTPNPPEPFTISASNLLVGPNVLAVQGHNLDFASSDYSVVVELVANDVECTGDGDCNDGVFCNGVETCQGGTCQSGQAIDCNDGVICTDDSCNEATDACSHNPNDGACSDGQFCNGPETCSPVNGCQPAVSAPCDGQMCDELSDQCAGCLSNADCDDGLFCNGQELCSGTQECQTGTPPDCASQQCSEAMDQCVDCLGDVHCGAGETCDVATGECILPQSPDPLPILVGDEWRYFKGTQEPPSAWNSTGFGDLSWLRGPGGFGYGADCASVHGTVLEDMQNSYVSLYMRRAFVVDDPSAVASLTLSVDYDDSFVAYLNGVEVARNNVTGTPPAHDQRAGVNHECSGSPAPNPPEPFSISASNLLVGPNLLAVQGHNLSPASSDYSLVVELVANDVECTSDGDCNDGVFCNGVETCQAGMCQSGQAIDCGDGDICTDDSCDENNDTCVNVFDVTNDPSCGPDICGNGLLDSGETCDPPGANPGLPNECRDDCSFCGDGVLDTGHSASEVLQDGGLENWLRNGQLESWRRSNMGGQVLRSTQVAHSGASSVELRGTQRGILRIFQEVQLQPGGSYRLDFWARTESVTGATPRIKINNMTRLEWLQQDGSWVPTERDALKGGLSQPNVWEPFSITFDVPANYDPQDVYRIALWNGSTALQFSIFYDDASLLGPLTGQEQCDDGNNAGGDGCSSDCTIEACGNGILDFGEACDPPGSNTGLANECRDDCTFCGDGVLDSGGSGRELLQDGGLENWLGNGQLDSWRRSIVGGEVLQATGVAHSGASSVELKGTQRGILRVFQEVQLQPGGTYRLDFLARTESVTGATPRVKINNMTRLEWLQQDGSWVPSERDALKGGLSQPNAWEPFSITFVVPASYDPADVYRIALWNGNTALQFSIFYDDASLLGPLTDGEQCDDGNNVNGDGCREDCTIDGARAHFNGEKVSLQPDLRGKPRTSSAQPGRNP